MSDEPTPGELKRRQDDLREEVRSGFQAMASRLDKMPTSELLIAHMATWDTQLRAVREDVEEGRRMSSANDKKIDRTAAELEKKIATATEDLRTGIKEGRAETTAAKRWAVGAVIAVAGVIVSALALVNSFAR